MDHLDLSPHFEATILEINTVKFGCLYPQPFLNACTNIYIFYFLFR